MGPNGFSRFLWTSPPPKKRLSRKKVRFGFLKRWKIQTSIALTLGEGTLEVKMDFFLEKNMFPDFLKQITYDGVSLDLYNYITTFTWLM